MWIHEHDLSGLKSTDGVLVPPHVIAEMSSPQTCPGIASLLTSHWNFRLELSFFDIKQEVELPLTKPEPNADAAQLPRQTLYRGESD